MIEGKDKVIDDQRKMLYWTSVTHDTLLLLGGTSVLRTTSLDNSHNKTGYATSIRCVKE